MDLPGGRLDDLRLRGAEAVLMGQRGGVGVFHGGGVPALDDSYHLRAGDGLLLQQIGHHLVHVLTVFPDDVHGVGIALVQDILHGLVHSGGGVLRAVQTVAAVQILAAAGGQSHHAELVAHAEHGNHVPGHAGGLLDVLRGAVGHGVHHHFLGGAATHGHSDLRHQLVPGPQLCLILLRHQQGVTQRALGVRDNGDLLDRFCVLLLVGHHGVTDLMVGHQLFLKFRQDAALFLRTGDNQLEGGQQVLLDHQLAALPDGPESGLIHKVGKVGAHAAGGGQRYLLQIDVLGQLDVPGMDLKGGQTARQIGTVDDDAAVEPAGPQKGLIQHLGPVGGGQKDDALGGVKAVHLGKKLVQGLLPLIIAAEAPGVTGFADGVDLIDEYDTGGYLGGLLKEVADTGRAHAHEHLHKVGAGDGEEGHIGFAGHGLGQQRFAGARRAYQQSTLGELGTDVGIFLGIVQEVDDLRQGFLGLVLTGHIGKGDAGLLFHVDLGVGLAHAADPAHASHAALFRHDPHDEGEHEHDEHKGQNEVDGEQEERAHLRLVLRVIVCFSGLVHPLHQSVIRLHLYGKELQRRGMLLAVGVGKSVNGLAVLIRGLGVGGAVLSSVDIAVLGDDIQQALGEVHGDVLHLLALHHGDEIAVLDVDVGGLLSGGSHVAAGAVEHQRQRQRPGHQLTGTQQVAVAPSVFIVFIVLVH